MLHAVDVALPEAKMFIRELWLWLDERSREAGFIDTALQDVGRSYEARNLEEVQPRCFHDELLVEL